MTVVLISRGHVEQVWHGAKICDIDRSRVSGELIEVEGPVAAGMAYKDGVFFAPSYRPTADEIRAEAKRRGDDVFPPALQAQIMARGGEFATAMFAYCLGVQRVAAEMLAMEAAPADYRENRHWPELPEFAGSPVPVVVAEVAKAEKTTEPGASQSQVIVKIEHSVAAPNGRNSPGFAGVIDHDPADAPLIDLDKSPAHAALLAELAGLADAKMRTLPEAVRAEFAARIANIATSRVLSAHDLAALPAVRAAVIRSIEAA